MGQEFAPTTRLIRSVPLALALVLASVPHASAALGPAEDAKVEFEKGMVAWSSQNYAEASPAFAKSYALQQNPKVLYAWAQNERMAGNCAAADRLFERYIDGGASEAGQKAARALIGDCVSSGVDVEPEPEPDVEPEPEPEPEGPTEPEKPVKDAKEPARKSTIFIGAGAAGTVVGIGLIAAGGGLDARAGNATSYEDLQKYRDPKSGRGKGAIPLYASGSILAAAGVGLLVLGVLKRKKENEKLSRLPTPSFGVGSRFTGLSLTWRR